jgi:hypothetical protein
VLGAVFELIAVSRDDIASAYAIGVAIASLGLWPVALSPQCIEDGILVASGATNQNGAVAPLRDVQRWVVIVMRRAFRLSAAACFVPSAA